MNGEREKIDWRVRVGQGSDRKVIRKHSFSTCFTQGNGVLLHPQAGNGRNKGHYTDRPRSKRSSNPSPSKSTLKEEQLEAKLSEKLKRIAKIQSGLLRLSHTNSVCSIETPAQSALSCILRELEQLRALAVGVESNLVRLEAGLVLKQGEAAC